jgi:hypothetical protein
MKIVVGAMMLAAASACALAQDASNPVVTSAKEIFQRQSSYMVTAAEQMPADEYGYHPTPDQVPILKQSFETCQKALDGLQDSSLGGTITYFRGAKKPRARALIELTDDLEDHYSQMSSYLRMNGMLPPSAKK